MQPHSTGELGQPIVSVERREIRHFMTLYMFHGGGTQKVSHFDVSKHTHSRESLFKQRRLFVCKHAMHTAHESHELHKIYFLNLKLSVTAIKSCPAVDRRKKNFYLSWSFCVFYNHLYICIQTDFFFAVKSQTTLNINILSSAVIINWSFSWNRMHNFSCIFFLCIDENTSHFYRNHRIGQTVQIRGEIQFIGFVWNTRFSNFSHTKHTSMYHITH